MQAPVTQLYENTWAIEDRGVRFFVLEGTERHHGGRAVRDAWIPDFDLRYRGVPVLLQPADILRREMKSK